MTIINKNSIITITIASFLLFSFKWILSFYFFSDDLSNKIIFDTPTDGYFYYVYLEAMSNLNFNNSFDLEIDELKALPLPFYAILIPSLIKFIFGDEWGGAGVYAHILVFSIGVRFVVSPLSVVLALDKFIHIGVSWQLYSFFSVLIVSLATAHLPLVDFLKFFVLQDILSYSLYLWLILSASKKIERP